MFEACHLEWYLHRFIDIINRNLKSEKSLKTNKWKATHKTGLDEDEFSFMQKSFWIDVRQRCHRFDHP